MILRRLLIFGLFSIALNVHALFEHDRAVCAGQRNCWDEAERLLKNVVCACPDDAAALYDLGVASFKNKEYKQAAGYFDAAAECAGDLLSVKEKAYFNAGNSCVEQRMLQEAIARYDAALALNAHNERAQHNREVVKRMLEEEKQKEQQQQEQKQKEEEKKEEQDKEQKEQEKQEGDQQKKNGENNKEKGADGSSDGANDNSSEQKSDGANNGDKESAKEEKNEQRQNGQSQKEQNSEMNKQDSAASKQEESQKESQKKENKSEQSSKQSGQPEKKERDQSTPAHSQKSSETEQAHASEKPQVTTGRLVDGLQQPEQIEEAQCEQWIARLLNEQEQNDEKSSKQLVKAMVRQKNSAHGENDGW